MLVLSVLVLTSLLGMSTAKVCLPNSCDNVEQPKLDCKGGIIKNAGFCGCTDICAKVEGESCSVRHLHGVPNLEICDAGLVCMSFIMEGYEGHKCVNASEVTDPSEPIIQVSRRGMCETACQRKSLQCAISMIVYEGQWFARCDQLGNFLPEQCDNTNHCFCVDTLTGEIQEGSKVLGSADCSSTA